MTPSSFEILRAQIDSAAAYALIREHTLKTPLFHSASLSRHTGANVFLKAENRQHTGSFKLRGAMNKILSLNSEERRRGVITASTGNHGMAVARASQIAGIRCTIYVPKTISPAKAAALSSYPAEIITCDADSLTTEYEAKAAAATRNAVWISPYNDVDIIAGQGTVAIEMMEQLQNVRAIYVTVGGGGLISGIALWFEAYASGVEVIACLPERSPEMYLSVQAGHVVHLETPQETLSDGSAGGMEEDSITLPVCRALVNRYLLVSEDAIADAIRSVYHSGGERIEGTAGVALAALRADAHRFQGENVAAVLCGGNIEERIFARIINQNKTDGHHSP